MVRAAFILGLLLIANLGQAQQLQRGEYFFDTDPGFGNGTAITFTSAAQVDLQLAIPVSGLTPGGHVMGIRMKDDAGSWGLTNRRSFTVAASVLGGDLATGEYYFDSDPGIGNATSFSFPAAAQVDLQLPITVGGLTPGGHVMGIRMKDDAGHWGLTNRRSFTVAASIVGGDLVAGEYFFDSDPGVGNATSFSFPAAQQIAYTQAFPVASLPPGGHVLGLRLKDIGGHWGLTNRRIFMVQQQAPGGDISAIEYFLDEDPGFGQGTPIAASGGPVINDLFFDVLTDTLAGGDHTLFVRAITEHGASSLTNAWRFDVLVGIDELVAYGINAWPNPMVDELFLQRDDFATPLQLVLLDAQGRTLLTEQWSGAQMRLEVGQLSAGNYLLLLQLESKVPLVVKLVKP